MELNFKLTEFEGPLDLLLHLIDKAQIAIEDIFVSDITEQYLEYVNTLPEINMESASEFLATAAMLLEIKSRRLLPKPPKMVREVSAVMPCRCFSEWFLPKINRRYLITW